MKEYTEERISLKAECLKPIRFLYSDLKNEYQKIVLLDILHPLKKKYEKMSYLIFEGYFTNYPTQKYLFNFSAVTFIKAFTQQINLDQFLEHQKIDMELEIKRLGYEILIQNIKVTTDVIK